jgi:hypothetical protein
LERRGPDKNAAKPTPLPSTGSTSSPQASSGPSATQHFQFKKPEATLPTGSVGTTQPPPKPSTPPAPLQNKPFDSTQGKPALPSLSQFIPQKPQQPPSTPSKPPAPVQSVPISKNLVDPYREAPSAEERSNMPASGPKPVMKDPKQPLPFSPDNGRGLSTVGTPPAAPFTPKPLPSLIKPPSPPSSEEPKIKKDPYRENMRD